MPGQSVIFQRPSFLTLIVFGYLSLGMTDLALILATGLLPLAFIVKGWSELKRTQLGWGTLEGDRSTEARNSLCSFPSTRRELLFALSGKIVIAPRI